MITFIRKQIAYVRSQLKRKAPLASPALTGNPTAPTQAPGNNSTRLATTAYVDAATAAFGPGGGALIYEVNASVTGAGAPTVNAVLANTLGAIVWTRGGLGTYLGTLAGAFPNANKIAFYYSMGTTNDTSLDGLILSLSRNNGNSILISSYNVDGVSADIDSECFTLIIKVYP